MSSTSVLAGGRSDVSQTATVVQGRPIVVTGRWLRKAALVDERFMDGDRLLADPESFVAALRVSGVKADIFTFAQGMTEAAPSFPSYFEWESAAVIPITSVAEWRARIFGHVARNLRRSVNRGVVIRSVAFDDALVRGVVDIYNETAIRQGRSFVHYGKTFDQVKRELSHRLDRSQFLGAYVGDELVGIAKLVRAGNTEHMVVILSRVAHRDKSPTSALIAAAVDVSVREGMSFLRYGLYSYVGNRTSSLSEFKHHNGFEPIVYPRYYLPLTSRGALVLRLRLHHGLRGVLPEKLLELGRRLRTQFYNLRATRSRAGITVRS